MTMAILAPEVSRQCNCPADANPTPHTHVLVHHQKIRSRYPHMTPINFPIYRALLNEMASRGLVILWEGSEEYTLTDKGQELKVRSDKLVGLDVPSGVPWSPELKSGEVSHSTL